MRIDQRNAGASVTASDTTNAVYTVDRWAYRVLAASKISFQRSTVAPSGYTNSLLLTSLSAYTIGTAEFLTVRQPIEGFNVADLGWGAAGASTVTLSFWVRSSLTGTFGGYVSNSAFNRIYVFSYTVNAANTWEQKTITIVGDTSGTWATDNSAGIFLAFSVGAGSGYQGTAGAWGSSTIVAPTGQVNVAGTNGATFYITGVQLEAGSVATPFERRDYGRELMMAQRYYAQVGAPDGSNPYAAIADGRVASATAATLRFKLPVTPRATPSASFNSATYALWEGTNNRSVGALSIYSFSGDGCEGDLATSGATTGAYVQIRGNAAAPNKPFIAFSMEL
jgi:hypothetical protein